MTDSIEPLAGALVRDFKRCGRPVCKCARGELHGPYLVRVWYEGGKRRKTYVKPSDVARIEAGIELFGLEHHAAMLRVSLARRISRIDRECLSDSLARVEAEAAAIRSGKG